MPNPKEALQEMIDPRLGGDYPIDSAVKVSDALMLANLVSQSVFVQLLHKRNTVLNCLNTCVLCTRLRTLESHARMKSPG